MKVTAWSNGKNSFGIRVGKANREEHFDSNWDSIQVKIGGDWHTFELTAGFWNKCPEFRGAQIRNWLDRQGKLEWPFRQPHPFQLKQAEGKGKGWFILS